MSQDHTLMASRYELKYLIPEQLAFRIRHFVAQHLEIDEFGLDQPDFSYPVHSLYFDCADWTIYGRTINGDRNRYKLRIRYYSEDPHIPVFFEIKRRKNDVILKHRCGVRRKAVPDILAGFDPHPDDLVTKTAEDLEALREFVRLHQCLQVRPRLHVAYRREAYVNDYNNEVRITMDRQIRAVLCPHFGLPTGMENPYVCMDDGLVILELKFTSRFPGWYRDLVETFNLVQTGGAKYVESAARHFGRNQHPRDQMRNLWI